MNPDLSRRIGAAMEESQAAPSLRDRIVAACDGVEDFEDMPAWVQQWLTDAEEELRKAYVRRFATREEAARYAANIRWHGQGEGVPAAPKPAGGGDEPPSSGWNPRSGEPMPTKITGEVDVSDIGGYVGIRDRNDWATVAETFQDGDGVVLLRNVNIGGGTAGMTVGAAVMLEGGTWVLMDLTNTATGPMGQGDTLDPQSEQNLRSFASDVYGMQSRVREMLGDGPARQVNKGVAFTSRPNPSDDYWSRQYGKPQRAVASGGDNYITVWGVNGLVRPVQASTYLHETGHNVETQVFGKTGKAALTYDYTTAVMADYQFLEPDGRMAPVYETLTQSHGGHRVKPEFDDSVRGANPYPYGITTYGKSSPAEEFAEAFRLFGWSGWGDRSIGTNQSGADVRFEELFPNRARMMRDYVDAVRSGRKIR